MKTDLNAIVTTAAASAQTATATKKPAERRPEPMSDDALDAELARASANTGLTFRRDKASNITVVTVLDRESGEILRQIPGEVALRIARELEKKGYGLIRDQA